MTQNLDQYHFLPFSYILIYTPYAIIVPNMNTIGQKQKRSSHLNP